MAWQAFGWAVLAASTLAAGAAIAFAVRIGNRTLGLVMAFGAGVLISAVAYELVLEAFATGGGLEVAVGLAAGALLFFAGDTLIARLGGLHRKRSHGRQASGSSLAIVLGTVLDGVPESVVLGVTLLEAGMVSVAVVVAIALSNLAESMAASTGLTAAGWPRIGIVGLWLLVILVCGLSALTGVVLLTGAPPAVVAFILAFAGGAILAMLADTMMPEAFEHGGRLVGLMTTLGFGLAFALTVVG